VDNIARETEGVIDQIMPRPLGLNRLTDRPPYRPTGPGIAGTEHNAGYVTFLDVTCW